MIKYVRKGRYGDSPAFSALVGMTFSKVEKVDQSYFSGNEAIRLHATDGRVFELTRDQDCCESVYIESIVGELDDLVGSVVLRAEEASQNDSNADESGTWTFYKLATLKGYVDIRFYGSSNGYYGESADLYEVEAKK